MSANRLGINASAFLLKNIRLLKLSVNGKLNTRMKCVNIGKAVESYAKTWLNGVINYFS